MDGILNVNKPSGPTSHDIVNRVRKLTGIKKVGHAGTLDPLASGVLVVFIGKATRLIEFVPGEPKDYTAELLLGVSKNTGDITGETIAEESSAHLTRDELEKAVRKFRGTIEQIPPMHSAIKQGGKPLYELARQGKTVERAARRITIYDIKVLDYVQSDHSVAKIKVLCSSGTYIRTLCEDIGSALGLPACMQSLVRNAVGRFHIENAFDPDQLQQMKDADCLQNALLPINAAVSELPEIVCDEDSVNRLIRGNPIEYTGSEMPGVVVSIVKTNQVLVGVGVILKESGRLIIKPEKILVQ